MEFAETFAVLVMMCVCALISFSMLTVIIFKLMKAQVAGWKTVVLGAIPDVIFQSALITLFIAERFTIYEVLTYVVLIGFALSFISFYKILDNLKNKGE